MIDFAHTLDKIAILLEILAERDDIRRIFAEMSDQIPHLRRVRAGAGHQTAARRRADRLLAIGALENDARFGDAVDVRTLDVVLAIAAELRAEIIHGDEQDIRLLRRGSGQSAGRSGNDGQDKSVEFHVRLIGCYSSPVDSCLFSFFLFFFFSILLAWRPEGSP